MLEDLFVVPQKVTINKKEYLLEYDNKGYATLESFTGKGIFKLKKLFIEDNDLTLDESINIICCSCLKHHTIEEIDGLRTYLSENIWSINELSQPVLYAFLHPLLSPEISGKIQKKLKPQAKNGKKKCKMKA